MDSDIRDLIPQHKHDLERAQALIERGYPAVSPVLPDLFIWLQDGNWPVSHVIAPFLVSLGLIVVDEVRKILASTDDIWKYWVLFFVIGESQELQEALHNELWRLATNPTVGEHLEDVDEIAREIIRKATNSP